MFGFKLLFLRRGKERDTAQPQVATPSLTVQDISEPPRQTELCQLTATKILLQSPSFQGNTFNIKTGVLLPIKFTFPLRNVFPSADLFVGQDQHINAILLLFRLMSWLSCTPLQCLCCLRPKAKWLCLSLLHFPGYFD